MSQEPEVLERHVVIEASPEQLWEALTEPEALAAWFGSQVEWDLRPGGAARFVEEDGSERSGVVDAVAPGRHLSFRWWPEDGPDAVASQVTYTLRPEAAGTRLIVTEQRMAPSASTARHRASASTGWTAWDTRLLRCWAMGSCVAVARASR